MTTTTDDDVPTFPSYNQITDLAETHGLVTWVCKDDRCLGHYFGPGGFSGGSADPCNDAAAALFAAGGHRDDDD